MDTDSKASSLSQGYDGTGYQLLPESRELVDTLSVPESFAELDGPGRTSLQSAVSSEAWSPVRSSQHLSGMFQQAAEGIVGRAKRIVLPDTLSNSSDGHSVTASSQRDDAVADALAKLEERRGSSSISAVRTGSAVMTQSPLDETIEAMHRASRQKCPELITSCKAPCKPFPQSGSDTVGTDLLRIGDQSISDASCRNQQDGSSSKTYGCISFETLMS